MADVPYTLTLVAAPTVEPVSLSDLKSFCRVDHSDEDDILERAIDAAIEAVQSRLGVQCVTATYDLKLYHFPCGEIELPRPPLQSVSSVKYTDVAAAQQTVSSSLYTVDTGSADVRGRVFPAYGQTWPSGSRGHVKGDAVVRFVTGFGATAASVPASIRHQILLVASHLYHTRSPVCCGGGGGVVPMTMDLLDSLNGIAEFR